MGYLRTKADGLRMAGQIQTSGRWRWADVKTRGVNEQRFRIALYPSVVDDDGDGMLAARIWASRSGFQLLRTEVTRLGCDDV